MENYVIVGILVILIIIGICSGIKHFKGEGGCCGGGSVVKTKRKKLKQIVKQRTVVIKGMTCEHCKTRVESRLNALEGVSVKVSLRRKNAVVSMEKDIEDEVIKRTMHYAFTVNDIAQYATSFYIFMDILWYQMYPAE